MPASSRDACCSSMMLSLQRDEVSQHCVCLCDVTQVVAVRYAFLLASHKLLCSHSVTGNSDLQAVRCKSSLSAVELCAPVQLIVNMCWLGVDKVDSFASVALLLVSRHCCYFLCGAVRHFCVGARDNQAILIKDSVLHLSWHPCDASTRRCGKA